MRSHRRAFWCVDGGLIPPRLAVFPELGADDLRENRRDAVVPEQVGEPFHPQAPHQSAFGPNPGRTASLCLGVSRCRGT